MQLAQPTRRERDDGRRDGLGDGERRAVDDAQRAALSGDLLERVVLGVVRVRRVPAELAVAARHVVRVERRREDVRVRRGHAAEHGLGDPEVLGQHGFRRVRDPVVYVEGGANQFEKKAPPRVRLFFRLLLGVFDCGKVLGCQIRFEAYPTASKFPSSNMSRNSFWSSRPCTVCAAPLGKYQMSPSSSLATSNCPSSLTAEIKIEPAYT